MLRGKNCIPRFEIKQRVRILDLGFTTGIVLGARLVDGVTGEYDYKIKLTDGTTYNALESRLKAI